jgi:hypothetical protein
MAIQLTWLLDEKQEESGASDLRNAIEAAGDRHLTISRREARNGTAAQTLPLHSCPTLAYGSIEFAKAIRADFYPGKWCDWAALRCEHYYATLGALLLNDDYILLPAGEVKRRQNVMLQQWQQMFLRPVRADKPFSGFVVARDQAEEIERQLSGVLSHDLIVLAPAKEIEAEYRTVAVRGRGIVAASQYMRESQLHIERETPVEALQVAEHVVTALGSDFPDPMYVVDIARYRGEYRLLEINGFSFASFYACDLEVIVRAAHEEAVREWQEMQG